MRFQLFRGSKAGLVAVFVILVFQAASSPVYAQAPAKLTDITIVVQSIIRILTPIAAIAFLAMMIFGAFKFITSGGDPKATAAARSVFTYAILGIILVIAAWLIINLIQQITKANVTNVNFSL